MLTTSQPIRIVVFAARLEALACGRSSGFGGAENELWNVAIRLAEFEDFEVRAMILTDEFAEQKMHGRLHLQPVTPATKLTYADSLLKRRKAIVRYFSKLYQAMRLQRAKIYYTKLACSEASTVWLASRFAKGKFVFRIEHDWETNFHDLRHIIFRGSWLWAKVFVFCLRRADLVIAQTHKQAANLRTNFGVDCVLIPNGHSMPAEDEVSSNPADRPDIIWVGRTDPVKRPELFIELARKNPQYNFVMIMPHSPEHTVLFDKSKSAAETVSNLRFIPGVAADEMDKFYQRARALVLTSTAEGFSNVIIEALKNGAPAISLGHNPDELLKDVTTGDSIEASAGFYTGESPMQTQEVVTKLLSDPDFWIECHHKAREVAIKTFGMDSVIAEYRKQFLRLGVQL